MTTGHRIRTSLSFRLRSRGKGISSAQQAAEPQVITARMKIFWRSAGRPVRTRPRRGTGKPADGFPNVFLATGQGRESGMQISQSRGNASVVIFRTLPLSASTALRIEAQSFSAISPANPFADSCS